MKKDTKTKEVYFGLAGLIGMILIIILATTLTPGSVFQGNLALRPAAGGCTRLNLISIPSPLKSGESAIILIKPVPESWNGSVRVSASSGILNDGYGNEGSIIETNEKIVSYGGGEVADRITVQAAGSGNEQCLGTIIIQGNAIISCQTLRITTDPAVLVADQSAVITIKTVPENYDGTFLIQADSGKFQLTSADVNAQGENTNTLVTSNKSIIYNGGKAGEGLRITGLGEKNPGCKDSLEIKVR